MNRVLIHTKNLKKYYQMGQSVIRALDDLEIDVIQNSFTVVMGPSGSGKSTLLHLAGGLDRPTEGEISFQDKRLDEMDENELALFRRQAVGFIFQSFNLLQSMSAMENVGFPMLFAGIAQKEREKRALDLLGRVGLSDRGDHHPNELSGGQQQRVAIARALVNDPVLILADEPTGNLDSTSGMTIMHLLSELNQSGHTIIVVTHDTRMLRFATDIIYLLDGRSVEEKEYQTANLE